MEGEAFLLGRWESITDLEEKITLPELELIMKSIHKKEDQNRRFAAALKGIQLEEGDSNERFEEVKRRAKARLSGKSEEELSFDDLDIEFEVEE